jgi:hypothetical protein
MSAPPPRQHEQSEGPHDYLKADHPGKQDLPRRSWVVIPLLIFGSIFLHSRLTIVTSRAPQAIADDHRGAIYACRHLGH